MDSLESDAQSFIVKVWVEDGSESDNQAMLRGHVTHVLSNQRRYLTDLGEIEDFIAPYLEAMGVKLGIRWRMRHWLRHLRERV